MSRKLRIEKIGFYHIINRGVAKTSIYLDKNDFKRFLEIVQDASDEYNFEIYSFCLMSNHYHLLLRTLEKNLSLTMQKINSRYSIYFNNKYKRVGPLWQGRFQSWYVYDEAYLKALVKYIEFNPIKAHITQNISEYKWSMSNRNFEYSMLNFELIEGVDFDKNLDEKELERVDELYHSKLDMKDDTVSKKELKPLKVYFENTLKEKAVYNAVVDGYTQKKVGEFLGISHVAISKICKIYKQKVQLFHKLRDKGIFWSYKKEITFEEIKENLIIEYLLKYGDFDDIRLGLNLFGKRATKKVWLERLASDKSFIKTNLLIARVFFGMDVEADYFKGVKNARFEKLRLLAS